MDPLKRFTAHLEEYWTLLIHVGKPRRGLRVPRNVLRTTLGDPLNRLAYPTPKLGTPSSLARALLTVCDHAIIVD